MYLPSDCLAGRLKVIQNPIEDALFVERRGKQTFNVFHDENGGTMISQDLKILNVKVLARVVLWNIVRFAFIPRTPSIRLGLAWGASNQHPFVGSGQASPDSPAYFGRVNPAQFGVPSFANGSVSSLGM